MKALELIENHRQCTLQTQAKFYRPPHTHTTLIKSLITLADPTTVIVNNTSYYDLANFLTVNPFPGRKDSGTPTRQTIRNYIQLVATLRGEHFKVITEGHTLQFLFQDIPKLFNNALKSIDVNTGHCSEEPHVRSGYSSVLDGRVNAELNIASAPPNFAAKNINIFNMHMSVIPIQSRLNKPRWSELSSTIASPSDPCGVSCETHNQFRSVSEINKAVPHQLKATEAQNDRIKNS